MWQLCMICTAAKTIRMNQNYDRPNAHSKQQKKQNCLFVWYKCNQLTCERHIFLPLLFSFTFDGYRMWWLVEYDFHVSYVYFYSSLKKLLGSFFFLSLLLSTQLLSSIFVLSEQPCVMLVDWPNTYFHSPEWMKPRYFHLFIRHELVPLSFTVSLMYTVQHRTERKSITMQKKTHTTNPISDHHQTYKWHQFDTQVFGYWVEMAGKLLCVCRIIFFSTSLFNVDKLRFDFQFASVTQWQKNTFQLNLCSPIFFYSYFFSMLVFSLLISISMQPMCEWYDWQNGIIQLAMCLQMILIIIVAAAVDSNDFNYRESLVMRWIINLERERETETHTNCKTPRLQKRNTIFACYFFRVIQFCSHFITFYWVTPAVITFSHTVQYSAHEHSIQPQPSGDSLW